MLQHDMEEKSYYTFEFIAQAPNYTCHALSTVCIGNGKFYRVNGGNWGMMRSIFLLLQDACTANYYSVITYIFLWVQDDSNGDVGGVTTYIFLQIDDGMAPKESVKGFNFHDDRVMNGQGVNEPHADMIQKFFRVLAPCHTAIPEVDEEGKKILYEAESPDEAAFVIAARELGFEMYERTQSHISLRELDHESHQKIDRPYELLHVLEFSSSRRRMSVIVRNAENQLLLLSKGSDSVMLEWLSKNSQDFEAVTMDHVKRYAEAGLQTLVLAYRELSKEEFSSWERVFGCQGNCWSR
ncbi:putative phospholipid-transporting ATPase 8 [Salvia divinorum]|uniref:Phospholipid-transporting ATPase 8 n=1 Tax=Salvia divinorum TaxID=28513 RepID=A0ABD1FK60_SALDI